MNKDAILASIIGFGIGLVITGGVILGPKLLLKVKDLQKNTGAVQSAQTNKQPSPTSIPSVNSSSITITSPAKDAIVNDATITVTGAAPKNAMLVVGGLLDEQVVETKEATNYQAKVGLKEGKNEVTVTGIINKQPVVQQITVYYTPGS